MERNTTPRAAPTARNDRPGPKPQVSARTPPESIPPGARSVATFCRAHDISRATFYNLFARGLGPAVMKVGRRTLISTDAAQAWRERMTVKAK